MIWRNIIKAIRSIGRRALTKPRIFVFSINTRRYEFNDWIKYRAFKMNRKTDQSRLISIIIPILGEGQQPNYRYEEDFSVLKNLLSNYLSRQTYKNYEAIVYCDGPNKMAQSFCDSLNDPRVKIYFLEKKTGLWGHPQTREGIVIAKGEFFVRMNFDNHPYPEYLETLISGFEEDIGIVYGRVIFAKKARRTYDKFLFTKNFNGISNELHSFIIPRDRRGALKDGNIDCMNYMVSSVIAKKYVNFWNDDFNADWWFIEGLLKNKIKAKFIDRILGYKC